ncbi:MAG: uroporphyrinogen-III C-methyltransferase [Elainellaceae cyanobacterium]
MSNSTGIVYLLGAGPGIVDHLTVRGRRLLAQADVLIYDALVDPALLALMSPQSLQINVGKRGGQISTPQAEINHLLIDHCRRGQRVVRLKSGDPFIFGRSAAELEALQAANCPYEVVPGISSALAAPLLAGIPLTEPVLSRCFAIFTAHDPDALNWEALVALDTLVIMMGTRHLTDIVEQLVRHGRSPKSPIAIIRWAGHPQQQIWEGTLESIEQKTSRQSLAPAVIVVGEVVNLRPYLQPTATLPLAGLSVLVTRSVGQSSGFRSRLERAGATVIEMPALEITPPSSWESLDQAIHQLDTYDWLVLTSSNGVNYFFDRLRHHGKDGRSLAGLRLAVVGQKTAQSLEQRGLVPDFIPPNYVADSLVEHFPDAPALAGRRILFPRVESGGRDVMVKEFTQRGAIVTEVAAYQSGCPAAIAPEVYTALETGTLDVVTFASSKTVRCFHQLVTQALAAPTSSAPNPDAQVAGAIAPLLSNICIASIGPQTSATCHELLGRVDVEATEYTLDGLTHALVEWANVHRKAI